MPDVVRTFTVELAEPGFGHLPKRHVVLAGQGDDVVHLWTSDPDLVDRLVPGVSVDLAVGDPAPEGAPRG